MVESAGLHGGNVGLHSGLCWITWWRVLGYMFGSVGLYVGMLGVNAGGVGLHGRVLGYMVGSVGLND